MRLDKPHGVKEWYDIRFKGAKSLNDELKVVSIYWENGKYWAGLPFEFETEAGSKVKTAKKTAVDVNVRHFNYTDGQINTLQLYKRIKHYQRLLARKRAVNRQKATQTNNYVKTKAKL